MRLIDANRLINETDDRYTLNEIGRRERDDIVNALEFAPTVDAIPISFIEKRIEQLKSHADYEFEGNGGYAGGSQYRLWELECLLDAWAKKGEE